MYVKLLCGYVEKEKREKVKIRLTFLTTHTLGQSLCKADALIRLSVSEIAVALDVTLGREVSNAIFFRSNKHLL